MVQWLRLHTPNAGDTSSICGQGTRSHMPQQRPGGSQINNSVSKYSKKIIPSHNKWKLMIEMAKWKLLKLAHSAKIRNDAISWLNCQGAVPHSSAPARVRTLRCAPQSLRNPRSGWAPVAHSHACSLMHPALVSILPHLTFLFPCQSFLGSPPK